MAEKLKGAILAAGSGERLRSSAGDLPKPLVEINGEPMLFRQIRAINEVGASPIHVIINSETRRLMREHRLESSSPVDWLVRDTENSMESLLHLGECIGSGHFLLATVDAVLPKREMARFVTYATKAAFNVAAELDGVIGVVRCESDSRPLYAHLGAEGMIVSLGGSEASLMTAGIYLFDTAIFAYADDAHRRGLSAMRQFLAMLVEGGERFAAFELSTAIDVDDGGSLAAARAMLAREPE
ncbi:MAG: NTP transferase domain-containing protein [Deltaproteobacteria bacterium]|nr:NTP transferase domain-containing protein [Deltaproteobacteria bacterium]